MRVSNPDLDCLRFHTEVNGEVRHDCPTKIAEQIFAETDLTHDQMNRLLFGKEEVRTVVLDDGTVMSCSNASAKRDAEMQGKYVRNDSGEIVPLDDAVDEIFSKVAPVSERFPANKEMKEMTKLSLRQRFSAGEEVWFMGELYQLVPEPESQAQAA